MKKFMMLVAIVAAFASCQSNHKKNAEIVVENDSEVAIVPAPIEVDEEINANSPRGEFADITKQGAKVKTFVIPTNEEYMIALDTQNLTK